MPEKGLNDVARPIREQFEKGITAIHRNNLDYAVTLLGALLGKEPGLYPAREALRDAQLRRAGARGGFLKRMLGTASVSPLLAKAQIELRSNPRQALETGEQILNSDPHSVAAHKIIADAALACDFPKTAVLSLQIAFKNAPDRDVALKLGEALARAGQVPRAETVLSDLARTFPNDPEIAQALKNLSAKRTLTEGGYEALADGQGSYRDILRDKAEAVALEQQKREVKSEDVTAKLIREYEADHRREPKNPRPVRSLAELYVQQRQYDKALAAYQLLIEIDGMSDPSLEKAITATSLRRFDDQMAALDPTLPEEAERRATVEAERNAYEISRMRRLVEQYPNDLALRFELGEVLFRQGKFTDAIQEFQKAQNNPHKRTVALLYLGRCFAQRGILDLAARTYQNALREKTVFDDEKKELIYALGTVLEKMGKASDAIEQYKLIYEVDIGYKDVAARVDAYYTAGQQ